jgi:hypothetical protein
MRIESELCCQNLWSVQEMAHQQWLPGPLHSAYVAASPEARSSSQLQAVQCTRWLNAVYPSTEGTAAGLPFTSSGLVRTVRDAQQQLVL